MFRVKNRDLLETITSHELLELIRLHILISHTLFLHNVTENHLTKIFLYVIYHHHHLSFNREGRWGTTDDFATSFLHFPLSPLPSGTCRTPGLYIP